MPAWHGSLLNLGSAAQRATIKERPAMSTGAVKHEVTRGEIYYMAGTAMVSGPVGFVDETLPPKEVRSGAEKCAIAIEAGTQAELEFLGVAYALRPEIVSVWEAVGLFAADEEEYDDVVERLVAVASDLVRRHKNGLEEVARRLEQTGTVSFDEIARLVGAADAVLLS